MCCAYWQPHHISFEPAANTALSITMLSSLATFCVYLQCLASSFCPGGRQRTLAQYQSAEAPIVQCAETEVSLPGAATPAACVCAPGTTEHHTGSSRTCERCTHTTATGFTDWHLETMALYKCICLVPSTAWLLYSAQSPCCVTGHHVLHNLDLVCVCLYVQATEARAARSAQSARGTQEATARRARGESNQELQRSWFLSFPLSQLHHCTSPCRQ